DSAPTEIYTLSLHDALPISRPARRPWPARRAARSWRRSRPPWPPRRPRPRRPRPRLAGPPSPRHAAPNHRSGRVRPHIRRAQCASLPDTTDIVPVGRPAWSRANCGFVLPLRDDGRGHRRHAMNAREPVAGFAIEAALEGGRWWCRPLPNTALTSLDAALTEVRKVAVEGAVLALLGVDDEFFVLIRPAPGGAELLLSD